MKQGDIHAMMRGHPTALVSTTSKTMHILTNMHKPPTEGNFCGEYEEVQTSVIITDYNQHMCYSDKGDRMVNSYSISGRRQK
jgi:hypothetical protein